MHCKDAPRYVYRKFRKSPAKKFSEVAYNQHPELYFSISRYSTTPHRDVKGFSSGYLAVDFPT